MKPIMNSAAIFDLLNAPIRCEILLTAYRGQVFDKLITPASAENVARSCGYDLGQTRLFLDALCALGFVHKQGAEYDLNPNVSDLLRSDTECSLRNLILDMADLSYGTIRELLHNPPDLPVVDMQSPEYWDALWDCLYSFHKGMGVTPMLGCLQHLPEWEQVRTMVDIGGGTDALAAAVVRAYSGKHVTILDQLPMVERINKSLSGQSDLTTKVAARVFDYGSPNLPRGVDLFWASMTLYFAHDLVEFLQEARMALNPGGVFVSYHEEFTDNHTRPEIHMTRRLLPALAGQDYRMQEGEISNAMQAAGFPFVVVRTVDTDFGPMAVTIGRVN